MPKKLGEVSKPVVKKGLETEKDRNEYVKKIVEPMADKFIEKHKNKKVTEKEVEGLYQDLMDSVAKVPDVMFKPDFYLTKSQDKSQFKEMVEESTRNINHWHEVKKDADRKKDHTITLKDKLMHSVGEFFDKVGAKIKSDILRELGTSLMSDKREKKARKLGSDAVVKNQVESIVSKVSKYTVQNKEINNSKSLKTTPGKASPSIKNSSGRRRSSSHNR